MQLANCWLVINKNGSDVRLTNVTPAELVLLVRNHQDNVGRHPIHDLEILEGDALKVISFEEQAFRDEAAASGDEVDALPKRTDKEEKIRLMQKYGTKVGEKEFKVDLLYPGENAKLPQTFEDTGLLELSQTKIIAK